MHQQNKELLQDFSWLFSKKFTKEEMRYLKWWKAKNYSKVYASKVFI